MASSVQIHAYFSVYIFSFLTYNSDPEASGRDDLAHYSYLPVRQAGLLYQMLGTGLYTSSFDAFAFQIFQNFLICHFREHFVQSIFLLSCKLYCIKIFFCFSFHISSILLASVYPIVYIRFLNL